jgi:hypothetical protein
MVKQKKLRVNTLDAIAVATDVYNQNNKRVVRDYEHSNKQAIYNYFELHAESINIDHAGARKIQDALNQRVMLNSLTGIETNGFIKEVNDLLQSDTVTSDRFGILAWAPKLHDDIARQDQVKETILSLSIGSTFVGVVGKSLEVDFHLLECRHMAHYDSFMHHGHDGFGNLLFAWHQKPIESGSRLRARVKDHRRDKKHHDAAITILNYIKVVNEK